MRSAFGAMAILWAIAIVAATWVASRPHPGTAAYTLAFGIYGTASWICHQRPERSFYLWAMQMPVCARCTGIYFGAAAMALGLLARRQPSASISAHRARIVFGIAAVPTAATLLFEWTRGTMPANVVRALAGVALGAAIAWIVNRAEVN